MRDRRQLLNLLGLAQRAGKLVSGEETVEKSVRGKQVKLVLMACDASENTKKAFTSLTAHHQVVMIETVTKDELGQCIGKSRRAVIGVMDNGFAQRIIDLNQIT